MEGFGGLRVLSLESRRSVEMARLIETYGGVPISAPAMREVPLSENGDALEFARELIAGSVDVVVFLTGVGARTLLNVVSAEHSPEIFLEALRKTKVAVRGPKPLSVMREWNVPAAVVAPEPSTWRELIASMDSLPGGLAAQRVAVQEYGVSNMELLNALRERGAIVRQVPVYQWALPLETEALREAVSAVLGGTIDVVLFTTGVQATHFFQIASDLGQREELRVTFQNLVVASIGPSTSETLAGFGIAVDMEPSHPKMGILVKEAAERSAGLLANKRGN